MTWCVNPMAGSFFSTRLRFICGLLVAGGMLHAGAFQAGAKTHKAKESPSPSPTPSDTPNKGIDIPIPINHSAQGVCFPIWTGGKLQMRYNMEVAYRVDADQLRLTQLKLETFDDNGKPEMTIDMPESMLNLQTRVITSAAPVTVRRTDLELVGKNMTFDTQTRQGKFIGPVRVLIYKQDDEPQAKAPAQTSPISE